jgi:hypothetical protein
MNEIPATKTPKIMQTNGSDVETTPIIEALE